MKKGASFSRKGITGKVNAGKRKAGAITEPKVHMCIPEGLPEAAWPQGERTGTQTYTIKGTNPDGSLNGCSIEVHLKLKKFYLNSMAADCKYKMVLNRVHKLEDPDCIGSVPRHIKFDWFNNLEQAWNWVADKTGFFGVKP